MVSINIEVYCTLHWEHRSELSVSCRGLTRAYTCRTRMFPEVFLRSSVPPSPHPLRQLQRLDQLTPRLLSFWRLSVCQCLLFVDRKVRALCFVLFTYLICSSCIRRRTCQIFAGTLPFQSYTSSLRVTWMFSHTKIRCNFEFTLIFSTLNYSFFFKYIIHQAATSFFLYQKF